jgi:hypothetical protein
VTTLPRTCEGCGAKPVATKMHRFCFNCEPGGPFEPPACKRCGATENYYSAGLCGSCHQCAPQPIRSCHDCLAWGVRRIHGGLCMACLTWRKKNPTISPCQVCRWERHVNGDLACRLCWRQAMASKRPRDPLDLIDRNRHGQQLFIADVDRISMVPPRVCPARPPRRSRRVHQLSLFDPPKRTWLARHGFDEPPNPTLATLLDTACADHARQHGWSKTSTQRTRWSLRALLGMLQHGDGPLSTSTVTAQFQGTGWPVRPVLAILSEVGMLDDDRVPAIDAWFQRQIVGLPPQITEELHAWFDVVCHGSATTPRSVPRQPILIRTRCYWALPTIRSWAEDGRQSLREISREDVLAALPSSGEDRARTAIGLRSIFRVLKANKLIFVNPTTRLDAGTLASREPLPVDVDRLRAILQSDDPARAALGALIIFHGLSKPDLCALRLTDIASSRLTIGDRTIPLAPAVRERIAAWLDHRNARWPTTANPHLFVNFRSATTLGPVGKQWLGLTLGVPVRALREDRILNEAHATQGDVRRLVDLFGLSANAAGRYTRTVDHPDLIDFDETR